MAVEHEVGDSITSWCGVKNQAQVCENSKPDEGIL